MRVFRKFHLKSDEREQQTDTENESDAKYYCFFIRRWVQDVFENAIKIVLKFFEGLDNKYRNHSSSPCVTFKTSE